MLVSNSRYNDPLLAAWQKMAAGDDAYPSNPGLLHDVIPAASALGLSAADAEHARVWIESRQSLSSPDRYRW
jgi:hypothetical protein